MTLRQSFYLALTVTIAGFCLSLVVSGGRWAVVAPLTILALLATVGTGIALAATSIRHRHGTAAPRHSSHPKPWYGPHRTGEPPHPGS